MAHKQQAMAQVPLTLLPSPTQGWSQPQGLCSLVY